MKSKLVMLISIGALALSASAPFAMASGRGITSSSRSPVSVSKSVRNSRTATAKRFSSHAAVPPHTILNGAKNNPF